MINNIQDINNNNNTEETPGIRFEDFYNSQTKELDLTWKLYDKPNEFLRLISFLIDHPEVESLNLKFNAIDDEAAALLATITTLKSLNLSENKITSEGAIALALNTTLTTLNLFHNKIGVDGAKALAANTNIKTLNLGRNAIGAQGIAALAERDPRVRANYGIAVGLETEVPSLLRLCLFNVQTSQIQVDQNVLPQEIIDKLNQPKV